MGGYTFVGIFTFDCLTCVSLMPFLTVFDLILDSLTVGWTVSDLIARPGGAFGFIVYVLTHIEVIIMWFCIGHGRTSLEQIHYVKIKQFY